MSRLFIALAFVAGIASSPAFARASNPSEPSAYVQQQAEPGGELSQTGLITRYHVRGAERSRTRW
jgi:hypothetical protein